MKTSFFTKNKKPELSSSTMGTTCTSSSTIEEGKYFSQDSSGHLDDGAEDPVVWQDNSNNNLQSAKKVNRRGRKMKPPSSMRKSTGSLFTNSSSSDHGGRVSKCKSHGANTKAAQQIQQQQPQPDPLSSLTEHTPARPRPRMTHQNARRSLSPKQQTRASKVGLNMMVSPAPFFTTAGKRVTMTAQAAVKGAGNATGTVVGRASNAVVDAGNVVGNTMVQGSKAIVGGTTQAIVGTTSVVGYGGKSVFKGTKKAYKSLKNATTFPFNGANNGNRSSSKSKWEEGLDLIDSLLDPQGDVYRVMTPVQREQLAGVKKLLLKAPGDDTQNIGINRKKRFQHVPRDLIRMSSGKNSRRNLLFRHSSGSMYRPNLRDSAQSTLSQSKYILEEYAGIMDTDSIIGDGSESELDIDMDDTDSEDGDPGETLSTAEESSDSGISGSGKEFADDDDEDLMVASPDRAAHRSTAATVVSPIAMKESQSFKVPTEFFSLPRDAQLEVWEMLKWESLGEWDFDVFELDKLTQGKPLLFLGWAIMGAPYSQHAMAMELGIESDISALSGYKFTDMLRIPSDKLCNFVRTIEQDYTSTNRYHNATHAADVVQTLHALIQSAQNEHYLKKCSKMDLFSILLAAICHDVCHPGTTNAFHVKLHSELAVMYNDSSVLENWHVAHAFSRMLGLDLRGPSGIHPGHDLFTKKNVQHAVPSENNLLCHATTEQFETVRKLMIDAILHTDMTNHFEMVNDARGMLMQQKDGSIKIEDVSWKMLKYMLHMADISSQAKIGRLAQQWTDRCMEEFFAQGDVEASLGMPISPLCDRKTVAIPDSQVGFIRFVVEPSFDVLGEYIPFVKHDVMPLIHDNLLRNLELQEQLEEAEAAAVENSPVMVKKEDSGGKEDTLAGDNGEDLAPVGSSASVDTVCSATGKVR